MIAFFHILGEFDLERENIRSRGDFMNYYEQIKSLFISNEIHKKVKDYSKNKSDVETYYNVGKLLIEAQGGEVRAKYGDNLIKEYSIKLIHELKDNKYSYRNLMNMRKFYLVFKNEKVNALRSQLSWSHYRELLSLKDFDKIKYYINLSIDNNLSYRELSQKIRGNEYERLGEETKKKLKDKEELKVPDLVKNPIQIRNTSSNDEISEKVLQKLILEDIESFLKELGNGFSFIESEYKIKMDDRYNYIDLLLYNYEFNCFVVVELKITELKKEHIGQVEFYMNYIDKNLKSINHNKTIGIIICKKENKYVIEYCSDDRIIAREYELI